MKKKRNWFARFLALGALVAAVIAVIVVASNTNLHSSSDKTSTTNHHAKSQQKKQAETKKPRTTAKTYEVQSGDTLTSIAHKEGMTVSELQALNPEVDAQTLIAGEVLQLQK